MISVQSLPISMGYKDETVCRAPCAAYFPGYKKRPNPCFLIPWDGSTSRDGCTVSKRPNCNCRLFAPPLLRYTVMDGCPK